MIRAASVSGLAAMGDISRAPAAKVAAEFRTLRAAADAIVDGEPPLPTFKAVAGASLACNPGPHATDLGVTDGSTGAVFDSALMGAA